MRCNLQRDFYLVGCRNSSVNKVLVMYPEFGAQYPFTHTHTQQTHIDIHTHTAQCCLVFFFLPESLPLCITQPLYPANLYTPISGPAWVVSPLRLPALRMSMND